MSISKPASRSAAKSAIVAFALSGKPPFGESNPNRIVARELSGEIDLDGYEPEIAEWLWSPAAGKSSAGE